MPFLSDIAGLLSSEPEAAGRVQKSLASSAGYAADKPVELFTYSFEKGALKDFLFLSYDVLVHSYNLLVFELSLIENHSGMSSRFTYGLLNGVQARVRFPLEAVSQNTLFHKREGAFLKPISRGNAVDLAKVDRISLALIRKSEEEALWEQTGVELSTGEPGLLEKPVILNRTILDSLGQDSRRSWPGKTGSFEEYKKRLESQQEEARQEAGSVKTYSKWGGYDAVSFEKKDFFYTRFANGRWWLVDPGGHPFWSSGIDCFTPSTVESAYTGLKSGLEWFPSPSDDGYEQAVYTGRDQLDYVDYMLLNLIRGFGIDNWRREWEKIMLFQFKQIGFNTIGNWSDTSIAVRNRIPYVTGIQLFFEKTPMIFRDFPDVYADCFDRDLELMAGQLEQFKDDQALIGYFLGNEPGWGFSDMTPAAGMLLNTPECKTRTAFKDFLASRYAGQAELSAAWGMDVTFSSVEKGKWYSEPPAGANKDLEEFSTIMIKKLFGSISAACKKADPVHLNLGCRFHTIPKKWAILGMDDFDVFSINSYNEVVQEKIETDIIEHVNKPILIGEFHFGALDAGLHASGIMRVANQEDRGKAYRVYVEDAASKPWCVGVHYFVLYDQSAMGRFDGEAYQIGFFDICNRPYEPLCRAARKTHEGLYDVVQGKSAPFKERPEYLRRLFC